MMKEKLTGIDFCETTLSRVSVRWAGLPASRGANLVPRFPAHIAHVRQLGPGSGRIRSTAVLFHQMYLSLGFRKSSLPTKSSSYCLLLLMKNLGWRCCEGVGFLKLIDKYIVSDEVGLGNNNSVPTDSTWAPAPSSGADVMCFCVCKIQGHYTYEKTHPPRTLP